MCTQRQERYCGDIIDLIFLNFIDFFGIFWFFFMSSRQQRTSPGFDLKNNYPIHPKSKNSKLASLSFPTNLEHGSKNYVGGT